MTPHPPACTPLVESDDWLWTNTLCLALDRLVCKQAARGRRVRSAMRPYADHRTHVVKVKELIKKVRAFLLLTA